MLRKIGTLLGPLLLVSTPVWANVPVTLLGSPASMIRQNEVAVEHNFNFLRTPEEVYPAVEAGELEWVLGDDNYALAYRSFPVARPELRLFIERLAAQYRAGCGEKLYVTSLTRPSTLQPPNAHRLSVHPAGMAVDLRISQNQQCQAWIEGTLLSLERQGILDITRENTPPHYHVALFPNAYLGYLEERAEAVLSEAEAIALTNADEVFPALAGAVASHGLIAAAEPASAPGMMADERERTGWIHRIVTLPGRLLGIFRRG